MKTIIITLIIISISACSDDNKMKVEEKAAIERAAIIQKSFKDAVIPLPEIEKIKPPQKSEKK